MRLDQDEECAARIANARQQSSSGDIEWPELDGAPGRNDLIGRDPEIVDLKQHLPPRRHIPIASNRKKSADGFLATLPHDINRMWCERLLGEPPSKEFTVELLKNRR